MDMLSNIPPRLRQWLYLLYALCGVAFGAVASSDGFTMPHWLAIALPIYAYVGTAFGVTAHANVPAPAALVKMPEEPAAPEPPNPAVSPPHA